MKAEVQIPIGEFAYVNVQIDNFTEDKLSYLKTFVDDLRSTFSAKPGLSDKDFNKCLDEYLNTGTLVDGTELYQQMNDKQQWLFQQLKKHEKRNNYQEYKIKQ